MTRLADDFVFSQTSLQDYVDCARRFELRYLLKVQYPAVLAEPLLEFERHTAMGAAFHRLVQQHMIGIPAERLAQGIQDEPLRRWWEHYRAFDLTTLPSAHRYPEIKLFARLGKYRLVAQVDLLAVDVGRRLVIVDWKTSLTRPNAARLKKRLQTIIYRYVLVESGAFLNDGQAVAPEQVEMLYWFAEYPHEPVKFNYDRDAHREARVYLETLVQEIEAREVFELTRDLRHCRYCQYRSLCERGAVAGDFAEIEEATSVPEAVSSGFDFDQIAEVEF